MFKFGFALFMMAAAAIARVEAADQARSAAQLAQAPQTCTPPELAECSSVLTPPHRVRAQGPDWPHALPGRAAQTEVNAAPATTPANRYVKQTEFDNTPYRFNMTQNGKRMTADDFDVWLRAHGYSVGPRVNRATTPD